ncbi:unnamed protein product [Toxocara canis]|uniref:Late endosomal/lysosomal adaptor and MAPK and MTOR activator 5 n=1 Tax=Toxocara canis TaxID=6265 RepID=A0A183V4A5_TOXCA|nr:unnamed protein product [Toxocara canis]
MPRGPKSMFTPHFSRKQATEICLKNYCSPSENPDPMVAWLKFCNIAASLFSVFERNGSLVGVVDSAHGEVTDRSAGMVGMVDTVASEMELATTMVGSTIRMSIISTSYFEQIPLLGLYLHMCIYR